jgi:hypothetical protein
LWFIVTPVWDFCHPWRGWGYQAEKSNPF